MRRIFAVLLLALGVAFAQADEGAPPATSPYAVLLSGGQAYCKASYDAGLPPELAVRALCYAELNVLDADAWRLAIATRFDFTPSFRTTPMVLLDYTQETWFAGLEMGYSLTGGSGWYVGTYVGLPLPALR